MGKDIQISIKTELTDRIDLIQLIDPLKIS